MTVTIIAYIVTGTIYYISTCIKALSSIIKAGDEASFETVIEAKEELKKQPFWKVCAWLYLPVSWVLSLILFISAISVSLIAGLFRKKN
jgi:hypothetical protein